jgi:hypothetical protein
MLKRFYWREVIVGQMELKIEEGVRGDLRLGVEWIAEPPLAGELMKIPKKNSEGLIVDSLEMVVEFRCSIVTPY